ncbi:MAG TPA: tetratricopeptide repeat protein, partial [Steroidobacteraceae bacterium]
MRVVILSTLAIAVAAFPTRPAEAQGANHAGGHGGDAIRCVSGRPEMAIIACTAIVEDKSEDADNRAIALRNRASFYQQKGDFDRAIADYTTALKHPEPRGVKAKIYLNRGLTYFRKGDEVGALDDYGEAVALDPKLASAYLNRATILMKRGDDDRAIADLDQA